MKKAAKKNRKYLIGGGQINTMGQLTRTVRAMLRKNPCVINPAIKVRFCGKMKVFNVDAFRTAQ